MIEPMYHAERMSDDLIGHEIFIDKINEVIAALNKSETGQHQPNTASPQLRGLVAVLRGSATISTTAVLTILYNEFPQLRA